jgi:hypothetical protein
VEHTRSAVSSTRRAWSGEKDTLATSPRRVRGRAGSV